MHKELIYSLVSEFVYDELSFKSFHFAYVTFFFHFLSELLLSHRLQVYKSVFCKPDFHLSSILCTFLLCLISHSVSLMYPLYFYWSSIPFCVPSAIVLYRISQFLLCTFIAHQFLTLFVLQLPTLLYPQACTSHLL